MLKSTTSRHRKTPRAAAFNSKALVAPAPETQRTTGKPSCRRVATHQEPRSGVVVRCAACLAIKTTEKDQRPIPTKGRANMPEKKKKTKKDIKVRHRDLKPRKDAK